MTTASAGEPGAKPGQGVTDPPEGSDKGNGTSGMTEAQVVEIVNRAISGRNKDFEKGLFKKLDEREAALTERIAGAVGEKFTALDEKLKAFAPKPEEGKGKGGKGKDDPEEESPALKELRELLTAQQKEVARLAKLNEASAKTAAEERTKARNAALDARALEELGKYGLTGKRAQLALKDLRDNIGYEHDKSDAVVFRKGDDVLPLGDGLKDWAASDDAKILLPPIGVQGSGGGPPGGPLGGGRKDPMTQLGESLAAHWNIPTSRTGG